MPTRISMNQSRHKMIRYVSLKLTAAKGFLKFLWSFVLVLDDVLQKVLKNLIGLVIENTT